MARTQAADYDERREAILDRAAALYAETGFLGSSIADLARACGVSKSLVYHYFASKEDILFDIMDGHIRALTDAAARVPSGAAPEAQLRQLTQAFMALYVGAANAQKVLVNDLDKLPPPRRASVVKAERALIEKVDALIGRLSPALAADQTARRAATMAYFGMINWTHTWFDPQGPITPEAYAEMSVAILLQGLPQ